MRSRRGAVCVRVAAADLKALIFDCDGEGRVGLKTSTRAVGVSLVLLQHHRINHASMCRVIRPCITLPTRDILVTSSACGS